ncbi:hypothetical protein P4O66_023115, partial [Electrophorus voltai]
PQNNMDDHELNPFGFHEPSFRKVKGGKIINTEVALFSSFPKGIFSSPSDSSSGIAKKVKFESNYYLRSPGPRIQGSVQPMAYLPWSFPPLEPQTRLRRRPASGETPVRSALARSGTTTSSTQSIAYSGCTADKKSVGDCEYQLGQNGILCSASNSYEVLHFLGCGSFGHVAKCSKKDTNEMVAIKILQNHPFFARQEKLNPETPERGKRRRVQLRARVRVLPAQEDMCLVFKMLGQSLYDFLKDSSSARFCLSASGPCCSRSPRRS